MNKYMAAILALCLLALPVYAGPTLLGDPETFGFRHVAEDNDSAGQIADGLTGESQLFVDVYSSYNGITIGSDQTLFVFRNTGPSACFIGGIYFYDGALLRVSDIIDGADPLVDFENNTNKLYDEKHVQGPGGVKNLVAGYEMVGQPDAESPGPQNGVNAGESLKILFDLQSETIYQDVIDGLNSQAIMIGLHVQGFDPDGRDNSEGFISTTKVPAPGAILLGSLGVSFVGYLRRRRAL